MNKTRFLLLSFQFSIMKLFDFVNKLREKEKKENEAEQKKEKSVCIPIHALSPEERKQKLKDTDSLVDKLKNNKPLDDDELEFIGEVRKEKPISEKNSLGLDIIDDPKREETIKETTKEIKKETKKAPIVPEKKSLAKKENKLYIKTEGSENTFRVNGTYDFGANMMISGMVESGVIKSRMVSKLEQKKELVISEIKIGSTKVNGLIRGEEGSIFVKTKGNPIIKYDDVLVFK